MRLQTPMCRDPKHPGIKPGGKRAGWANQFSRLPHRCQNHHLNHHGLQESL